MKRIILLLFTLFFINLFFSPIKISASEVSEKYYAFISEGIVKFFENKDIDESHNISDYFDEELCRLLNAKIEMDKFQRQNVEITYQEYNVTIVPYEEDKWYQNDTEIYASVQVIRTWYYSSELTTTSELLDITIKNDNGKYIIIGCYNRDESINYGPIDSIFKNAQLTKTSEDIHKILDDYVADFKEQYAEKVEQMQNEVTKDWTRANFHAADNYGIPDDRMSKIDEFLMDFIRENVPEDAVYETDLVAGDALPGVRKNIDVYAKGYCFSYTEESVEKQIAIFDYVEEDRVYRADNLWIHIIGLPILDVQGKMYAYEDNEWKYIEEVKPYLQEGIRGYGGRLLVPGEQWENNYEKSRLLITVTIEKNPPEGAGYIYMPTVQKRRYNTIWIGNYPIEFYWKDAFKVFLWIGVSATILVILIRKRIDKKKYK